MPEELIKLKRSNDKIISEPLNYIVEFIIAYEKIFAFENPYYYEYKRFSFYTFILQLFHQSGDYIVDSKIGYTAIQYFMENPEKLDLDIVYESDEAKYLMKDELEIKKSDCLLQVLRAINDEQEFIEKLISLQSPL